MIKVLIKKQSNYPVSAKLIRDTLKVFFTEEGIISDALVSVAIVGKKKMLELGKRYLKDKALHNILSFTEDELGKRFVYPPEKIYLGEIILCYPKTVEEAKEEDILVDEKVKELILHSAEHLMGRHHE
jgi:probable rRNA maturation factor